LVLVKLVVRRGSGGIQTPSELAPANLFDALLQRAV